MKKFLDEAEVKYRVLENDIGYVNKSISMLQKSREQLMSRYRYLTSNIKLSEDKH